MDALGECERLRAREAKEQEIKRLRGPFGVTASVGEIGVGSYIPEARGFIV